MSPLVRWIPAAFLIAVAVTQIYTARTGVLTPSKGGGFGMFSVTDIRGNRTWSAECLTPEGEPCRIYLPRDDTPFGERFSKRFRAKPDAAILLAVANALERSGFVRTDAASLRREAEMRADRLDEAPREWLEGPVFRLAEPGEATTPLRAIRLRAWRLRFDADRPGYRVEPLGEPEARGAW